MKKLWFYFTVVILLFLLIGLWIYMYIDFKVKEQILRIENEQRSIDGKFVELKQKSARLYIDVRKAEFERSSKLLPQIAGA